MRTFLVGVLSVLVIFTQSMAMAQYQPGSLYPQNWKFHKIEDYEKLDETPTRPRELAKGGKVVAAGLLSSRAVAAAQEVLKQGGTAADAVLAGMLVEITLSAGRFVSFAGILGVLYYDALTRKTEYLSAGYGMPKTIKETKPGAVLVPGFMMGVETLHKKYGRLPFAAVFEPSIGIAENGFKIDSILGSQIKSHKNTITRLSGGKEVFLKPDGAPYSAGDIFTQPRLAQTLKRVSQEGASYMYSGEWGQKLVALLDSEGGGLAQLDLNNYRAFLIEPLMTDYKGHKIYVPGVVDFGGAEVIEAMEVVERAKFFETYGDPVKSASFLYWLIKLTGLSRNMSTSLISRALLDLATDPAERVQDKNIEKIWTFLQEKRAPKKVNKSNHSSSFIVVDAEGNIAVAEHSINTIVWGGLGYFVDGVSIPDSARIQGELLAMSEGLEHLPNPLNPVIVMKNDKPYILSSCVGSALLEHTVQHLIDLIDLDLDPLTSQQRPKFHGPTEYTKTEFSPDEFDPEVLKRLEEMGEEPKISEDVSPGLWIGVKWNEAVRSYEGATSTRLPIPSHIEIGN